jgi:YD repeat-containing protein
MLTPVRGSGSRLTLFAITLSLWAPIAVADDDSIDARGLQQGRQYFGQLPFEYVDVYSGALILRFTDLVLPGNAGSELRLERHYNSKGAAAGTMGRWTFGFGRVMAAHDQGSSSPYPVIEAADGSAHYSYRRTDGWFMTTDDWFYDRASSTLWQPDGTIWTYAYYDGLRNVRYPTARVDAFNNLTTFDYLTPIVGGEPLLSQVTQHLGQGQTRVVSYAYLSGSGLPYSMTYLNRTWQYFWNQPNSNGPSNLVQVVPPSSGSWYFLYDLSNRVTAVTTPNGGTIAYWYVQHPQNPSSTVVSQRRTYGRQLAAGTWNFFFQAAGANLTRTTITGPATQTVYLSSAGNVIQRDVSAAGVVQETTSLTWMNGVSVGTPNPAAPSVPPATRRLLTNQTVYRSNRTFATTFTYQTSNNNDYGQPSTVTETGDFTRTTTRAYRHNFDGYTRGKLTSETISVGNETFATSYEYAANGFMTAATTYGIRTTYNPDSFGNVASETDANGRTTSYAYAWGTAATTFTPAFTITRSINSDGTVASESRQNQSFSYSYDGLGRETRRTPPVGASTVTSYNGGGSFSEESITIQRGASQTTVSLDGFGRPIKTSNSVGVNTETQYDAESRKIAETAPFGGTYGSRWTTFTYDGLDRLTRRTNPDNSAVTFNYSGATVAITDEEGQGVTQTWAGTGTPEQLRLVSVADTTGTTFYTYNTLGRLTGVSQPGLPSRTWQYNNRNQLSSETQPESGIANYQYDAAGNLSVRADGRSVNLLYTYDGNNRVTRITGLGASNITTIGYDAWDNRTAFDNGWIQSVFTYGNGVRLLSRTDTIRPSGPSAGGQTFTTSYTEYDDRNNIKKLRYPSGNEVWYDYDTENRITRAYGPAGRVYASDVAYHPSGAPTFYRSGNGIQNTLSYDARGRVAAITAAGFHVTYGYDRRGNVLTTSGLNGSWSHNQSFTYDGVSRLIAANGTYGQRVFGYDAAGNRISTHNTQYMYSGNRLICRWVGICDPFWTYSYDAVGNTLGDERGRYTYTPRNMIETAQLHGLVTTYRYDEDDLRILKRWTDKTHFYVHGTGGQLLTELEALPNGSTAWLQDYVYLGTRLLATLSNHPHTLTIRVAGAGAGTVTSTPAGIACPGDCTEIYRGQSVSLTGTADAASVLVGWTGDADCADGAVMMNADKTCTATFAIARTLTISKIGAGSGRVTSVPGGLSCGDVCTAKFPVNGTVTLTALASSGSIFVEWTGEPDCRDGVVTLSENMSCTAAFAIARVLSIVKNGGGAGTVTSTPAGIACGTACTAAFVVHTTVTLTAVPATGIVFTGWAGAADCADGVVTLNVDTTCDAIFVPRMSIGDATAAEGNAVAFTITLSGASQQAITVHYATAPGTAMQGIDFAERSGELTIPPSTVTIVLAVPTLRDPQTQPGEPSETLTVHLSAPIRAIIQDADAEGTILNRRSDDFDGDGQTDILWQHSTTGAVVVWHMNGAARRDWVTVLGGSDPNWRIVDVGDFDGDRRPDLLWQHQANHNLVFWLMNDTTFLGSGAPTPSLVSAGWTIRTVGDVNHDDKLDWLWQYTTGTNVVWLMNGLTLGGGAALLPGADPSWHMVATADLNLDGETDIVWQHQPTGLVVVWYMTGTTFNSAAVVTAVGDANWRIRGVGDFNRDGHADFVWHHAQSGQIVIWFMNGATYRDYAVVDHGSDPSWRIVGVR